MKREEGEGKKSGALQRLQWIQHRRHRQSNGACTQPQQDLKNEYRTRKRANLERARISESERKISEIPFLLEDKPPVTLARLFKQCPLRRNFMFNQSDNLIMFKVEKAP
jgi:hypothetical protein